MYSVHSCHCILFYILVMCFRIRFHIIFHRVFCGMECGIALRKCTPFFLVLCSWKILSRILTFSWLDHMVLRRIGWRIYEVLHTPCPRLNYMFLYSVQWHIDVCCGLLLLPFILTCPMSFISPLHRYHFHSVGTPIDNPYSTVYECSSVAWIILQASKLCWYRQGSSQFNTPTFM